MFEIEHVVL